MGRHVGIVGLAFVLAVLAGCSRDADPLVRYGISTDTPQAVGAAWIAAMDEGDFETVVACLAPETVKQTAARMALEGLQSRDRLEVKWDQHGMPKRAGRREERAWEEGEWEAQERRRQQLAERVAPVLLDHGLTQQTSEDVFFHAIREETLKTLARKIRDPAGFCADYLEATRQSVPLWRAEKLPPPRIGDVSIDGNHAKGRVIYRSNRVGRDGKPIHFPKSLTFVRLPDSNWRIDEDYVDAFFDEK